MHTSPAAPVSRSYARRSETGGENCTLRDRAPALWVERMAVLVSSDGHDAIRAADRSLDFHLEVFTDAAEMLLMCGAHPPTCTLIDSRADQLPLTSAVAALVNRAAIPVFVGVWDDQKSKKRALAGLEAGARGLVPMPATWTDLEHALRTSGGRGNAGFTKVEVGSVALFHESRDVWIRDVKLNLAEIEFGVLWCLLRAFPRPVSLDDLAGGCGEFAPCKPDALKARVSRVRRKIEAAVPGAGAVLTSVPGVGYVAKEFY